MSVCVCVCDRGRERDFRRQTKLLFLSLLFFIPFLLNWCSVTFLWGGRGGDGSPPLSLRLALAWLASVKCPQGVSRETWTEKHRTPQWVDTLWRMHVCLLDPVQSFFNAPHSAALQELWRISFNSSAS